MNKKRGELTERVEPVQDRAKRSVDSILETAAILLDEVGFDGFNTNLLAERAGVRIRTVYRYFPNKYAVIVALTKRLAVQWDSWILDFYAQIADPASDWKAGIRRSKREWLRRAQAVPGALSVLQATTATPELAELNFQVYEEMTRKLAGALLARGLRADSAKLKAIARTIINSTNSATDYYLRLSGKDAEDFWDEVTLSEELYLEYYFSGAGATVLRKRGSGSSTAKRASGKRRART